MQRIRIEREAAKPRPRSEVLSLDPRDPDIVRAKRLLDRAPGRQRAAYGGLGSSKSTARRS
jgi:hypothetical protein